MFRIDKTRISYERSEAAYTKITTELRPAQSVSGMNKAEEAQVLNDLEEQLKEKIKDAENTAKAILSGAREKAGQLVRQAEADAKETLEAAEEKGYIDGMHKAKQEAKAHLDKQTEAVQSLINQISSARDDMLEELEGEIISLVLETVKKIINLELERNDKVFVDIVQNALGQMKREGKIVIRVSQDDYSRFFSSGSTEIILDNERIKATVIEEPLFEKGDCVIESEGGTVNAGINSQLRHIEFAFRNEESHIA